jgi:hypothetical protein
MDRMGDRIQFPNSDLMVLGQPAADLDLDAYSGSNLLSDWEYAAYDAYGQDRCDQEGVIELDGIFGEEFYRLFRARHKLLYSQYHIQELQNEIIEIEIQIRDYRLDIAKQKEILAK